VPDDPVKVDLHPMHLQVLAHLAILQAGVPADDKAKRAIDALKQCDTALRNITCSGMGVFVSFNK
jgi:hypothetical protein